MIQERRPEAKIWGYIMRERTRLTDNMSLKASKAVPDSKLVVLGDPGVGKSALVVRYLTKRFIWEYDPTLECTYRHIAHLDDETPLLEILDTAGQVQDSYSNVDGHVRWGDGFLIVYNITDRVSFERVRHIKRQLDDIRKFRNVSAVIVGNKTDLEHERQVTSEEGEKLAAECACAFFETSACDGGSDIEEAFHELHREIKRRKAIEGKTRRRSSAQQMKQVLNKVLTKIQNG